MVLIDSSNSHNILRLRIAYYLQLPITATRKFFVMVSNGDKLHCEGICEYLYTNKVMLSLYFSTFYPLKGLMLF